MTRPGDLLRALEELEGALEDFRAAYTAWLARELDDAALSRALAAAQARLDAARAALTSAGSDQ